MIKTILSKIQASRFIIIICCIFFGNQINAYALTEDAILPLPEGVTIVAHNGNNFVYVSPSTWWWPVYYCATGCNVDNVHVICSGTACSGNPDTYISGKFRTSNIKSFKIQAIPTNDSRGVGVLTACGRTVQTPWLEAPGKGTPGGNPSALITYTMIVNGTNCTTWKLTTTWKVYIKAVYVDFVIPTLTRTPTPTPTPPNVVITNTPTRTPTPLPTIVPSDTPVPTIAPTLIPLPDCDYGDPYPLTDDPLQSPVGDINMSVDPFPQINSKQITLRANQTYTDANLPFMINLTNMDFSPFLLNACTTSNSGIIMTNTCTAVGPPGTYSWTANYLIYDTTGVQSPRNCSKTSIFKIQDPPGYLLTSGGDTYLRFGFDMPSFEDFAQPECLANKNNCLSDYFYGCDTGSNPYPYCRISSNKNYFKANYLDQNLPYLDYDALSSSISAKATQQGMTVQNNVAPANAFNLPANSKNVVILSGNLTINSGTQCNTATIYFIPGDLTIDPDFTINGSITPSSKALGCMFIINGNLIIEGGTTKGTNNYDLIHGFFILANDGSQIIVQRDGYDLLKIIGGIVSRDIVIDQIDRRAVNTATTMPPTEVIIYEGGRYINNFGDLFVDKGAFFNINETPFINTLDQ